MPLWLASFAGSTFDQSDWLKLLGIAGAAVALYLVARRLGGGGESCPPPMDTSSATQISTSQTELVEPPESAGREEEDSRESDSVEQPAKEEPEVQPRNIEITSWNFAKFEIAAGPPDRESFADELTVKLYDKSTGRSWKQTYVVTTLASLEKMQRRRKSNFVFLPQILSMNRYDINELRKAVLGDIARIEDQRGDVPPDTSDDTAAEQQS